MKSIPFKIPKDGRCAGCGNKSHFIGFCHKLMLVAPAIPDPNPYFHNAGFPDEHIYEIPMCNKCDYKKLRMRGFSVFARKE